MNKLQINHSVDDVDREEIRRRDAALPRLTVATLKILKSTFPESCRPRAPGMRDFRVLGLKEFSSMMLRSMLRCV